MNQAHKSLVDWLQDTDFNSINQLQQNTLRKTSKEKALQLFHKAAVQIPAYKDFLKLHKINPSTIKTFGDFSKVPATTKENYIEAYPLHLRVWNSKVTHSHMISTSSGTTGVPHFWPRDLQAEIEGSYAHEYLFRHVLDIGNDSTLFVNGFAMGNWIAGTFTHACTHLTSWKGFPITSVTPGYSAEEIISVLKGIGNYFERIIIAGHSPFLKDLVEEAVNQGVDWSKINVTLLGTGQAITEQWRDYLIDVTKNTDSLRSVLNLYGSADAALMGIETPLTIYLRRILSDKRDLLNSTFNSNRLPSLYQYDPRLTYFESVQEELHITKYSSCPLIRYNIKDEGGVFDYKEFLKQFTNIPKTPQLLKKLKYHHAELPFVYLFGRDKFMIKLYGANIYTEHVQQALNHTHLQSHITGRFILEEGFDEDQNPLLLCHIELTRQTSLEKDDLNKLIHTTFIDEVSRLNSEYNFILNQLGDKVKPQILLYEHGDDTRFPKGKIKKHT